MELCPLGLNFFKSMSPLIPGFQKAKSRNGSFFVSFIPAISNEAVKSIRLAIRQWYFTWRTDKSPENLSDMFNSVIRGWTNYYGSFYKSALYSTFQHPDHVLAWQASRKYKKLRGAIDGHVNGCGGIFRHQPWLFTQLAPLSVWGWTIEAG